MNERSQQSCDAQSIFRKWAIERGVDRLIELSQSKDKRVISACERRLGALVHEMRKAGQ